MQVPLGIPGNLCLPLPHTGFPVTAQGSALTSEDHFGLGCSAEVMINLNQEMWKRLGCAYGGRGLNQELCALLRRLCRGNSFFLQT